VLKSIAVPDGDGVYSVHSGSPILQPLMTWKTSSLAWPPWAFRQRQEDPADRDGKYVLAGILGTTAGHP
jgi:hypothetical protein